MITQYVAEISAEPEIAKLRLPAIDDQAPREELMLRVSRRITPLWK
jgi:hypothetical protein